MCCQVQLWKISECLEGLQANLFQDSYGCQVELHLKIQFLHFVNSIPATLQEGRKDSLLPVAGVWFALKPNLWTSASDGNILMKGISDFS